MNNQGGNNNSNLNGESPSAMWTKNTNQGIQHGIVRDEISNIIIGYDIENVNIGYLKSDI